MSTSILTNRSFLIWSNINLFYTFIKCFSLSRKLKLRIHEYTQDRPATQFLVSTHQLQNHWDKQCSWWTVTKRLQHRRKGWKDIPSGITLFWDWLIVGWAATRKASGKEGGYVRNDPHERAGQWRLWRRCYGDDDIILVPHVEGVGVWVDEGRRHLEWADPLCHAIFFHVLIDWTQQTVCGSMTNGRWWKITSGDFTWLINWELEDKSRGKKRKNRSMGNRNQH